MKWFTFVITLSLVITALVSGQNAKQEQALEQKIRALEQEQVNLLLRDDLAGMKKNWADDFVVNNPFNEAVDASRGPIQMGTLKYSSFVRDVERVLLRGDTIIVMGNETIVPKGNSPDAGKTLKRRFTNIWMKRNDQWLMAARHANVICQN